MLKHDAHFRAGVFLAGTISEKGADVRINYGNPRPDHRRILFILLPI
jgi:hypothetical protein